jgi:alanyl-tRNA synthetase
MPETAVKTASQIRREFLDFFTEKHGHSFVPSSPVVPHDDPTLLFANAGMNQFKDVFLGHGSRDYVRAVNTQKCIRAGGKHNDLEDVGKDTYHHTFFEMLGNWSFGNYFKAEAIEWAWDLLVNLWGLEADRLYATVFAGEESEGTDPDVEAEELWKRFLPDDHISRWGKKDNFWEMGETGPCGPCSEIHYDGRSEADRAETPGRELVNRDHPDVIEIWNLVFIQFNRTGESVLTPLPARHVDTGMGFERVVRVIQGKDSNYDIDLWQPIFAAISERTGAHPYQGRLDDPVDTAYRVIADHIRCLTMAINDGAIPSNEGRGYVLRRILRRAVRHAHQTLEIREPVLCDLVPSVIESLGDAFPELKQNPSRIEHIIRDEEESFLRTLDRGLNRFALAAIESLARKMNGRFAGEATSAAVNLPDGADHAAAMDSYQINTPDKLVSIPKDQLWNVVRENLPLEIPAEDAFRLHDTYGFPIDLTRIMAEERGMTVDEAGYEKLMAEARERSRAVSEESAGFGLTPDAVAKLQYKQIRPTKDVDKYHGRTITATIEAIWDGDSFDQVAHTGAHVGVILDRTNHYAEAGGQVGDQGEIVADVFDIGVSPTRGYGGTESRGGGRFRVDDTQAFGGYVLHIGRVTDDKIRVGDKVMVNVDLDRRRPTMANHTGTHLLNLALRDVLGDDVHQRGSLVAPDRLRFDFTATHAMTPGQIERAQSLVRERIEQGLEVYSDTVPLELGQRIHGLRAVFGERYPDVVRVVSIGKPVDELVKAPENEDWYQFSIEFCGGTHVPTTDAIGTFTIVSEQALAAGVRRITALTGAAAHAALITGESLEQRANEANHLEGETLIDAFESIASDFEHLMLDATVRHRLTPVIDELRERVKQVRKQAESEARSGVVEQAREIANGASDADYIVAHLDNADKDMLLAAIDVIKSKCPDAAIMLFAPDEEAGKVSIVARVPDDLIEQGLKAGDWVREAAKVCGGGGGGRPDMAQAGGKDPAKIPDAMQAAKQYAEKVTV